MTKIWVRLKCDCGEDCGCDEGQILSDDGNSVVTCKKCDGKGFNEDWRELTELWWLIRQDQLHEEKIGRIFDKRE